MNNKIHVSIILGSIAIGLFAPASVQDLSNSNYNLLAFFGVIIMIIAMIFLVIPTNKRESKFLLLYFNSILSGIIAGAIILSYQIFYQSSLQFNTTKVFLTIFFSIYIFVIGFQIYNLNN